MAIAAPLAAPLSIAATGLSAFGSLAQGQTSSQGMQMEAQNAVNAAEMGKTAAAQTDTYMRRQLSSQLANITAVRASAGLNPNSPTGAAIAANFGAQSDQARVTQLTNINQQVSMNQQAANFYTTSAGNALTGGIFGAMGSIFKGIGGAIPA